MQTIAIIGSTGSIGRNTLEICARHPERYQVIALANNTDPAIIAQATACGAHTIAQSNPTPPGRLELEDWASVAGRTLIDGPDGPRAVAALGADIVVNAIDGTQGIASTLAALQAGSKLALANKESLVGGGEFITGAQQYDQQIVPIDSEHAALLQAIGGAPARLVDRLVLTASGGPFLGKTQADLAQVTPQDVLNHPTWSMGALVTVNSASLANKGLEVIEAHHLFGVPFERIDVVVHPQSIVHSMVEFIDGSTLAQLSPPDMRSPIQMALAWPDRLGYKPVRMDWTQAHQLTFMPPDYETFPMLQTFIEAGQTGGVAPIICTAANEEAVHALLHQGLPYLALHDIVTHTQATLGTSPVRTIQDILEAEQAARTVARATISTRLAAS